MKTGILKRLRNKYQGILIAWSLLVIGISEAAEPIKIPHFTINQYEITGNHKLSSENLQTIVAEFTGQDRDFATIQSAVVAIKQAYKAAGYEMMRVIIPKQEIQDGIIHLQIFEATLGKVLVKGNQYFDEENIRRAIPALQEGETTNVEDLSADLRLANENSAKHTQVKFSEDDDLHAVDATVNVADARPWHLASSIDNTGTDKTGNWRWGFAFIHNNMFNRDHVLSGQYVTSPDYWNNVQIFGLNYLIPLYGIGHELQLSGNSSSVNSGVVNTPAGSYGISGSGQSVGVHYIHLLPQFLSLEQRLNFGFDYRYFQNNVSFLGSNTGSQVPDVIVHPISLAYTALFHQAEQDLSFQLGLYQNIPGGNLGDTQALHAVRSSANPAYTLLRYALNFNQILPADWQLRAAFNGQQTNDALISGEQFGIGGINSVRGFQERSLANDKGYRGSIELYTPDFGQHVDVVPLNIRALGFFNVANVSRNFALPREAANGHLSSIGLGLRASLDSHFQFRVDISQVLDSGGLTSVGKKLAQASLVYMF